MRENMECTFYVRLSLSLCFIAVVTMLYFGCPARAYSVSDIYYLEDSDARVAWLDMDGSRVYASAGSGGLYILDVSNPMDIQKLGHYALPGADLETIVVRGDYAFVNDWNFGLRVFDIHDADNISQIASWEYSGSSYQARALTIEGDYAYFSPANRNAMQVLDISDLSDIQPVGSFKLCDYSARAGTVMATSIVGDTLFASFGFGGFHFIDISDPTNPTYLDGTYHNYGHSDDALFDIRDGYAFLAGGEHGFFVIDVSDPENLDEVFEHDFTPDGIEGLYNIKLGPQFDDGTQFLFTWAKFIGEDHMYVWDVTDPENPIEVGVFDSASTTDMGRAIGYYEGYLVSGSRNMPRAFTFDVTEFHVPEPSTVVLLISGVLGMGALVRSRMEK